MAKPKLPGSKTPATFNFPPDLLRRLRQYAADQHRTTTTTLELLLEDALGRVGYARHAAAEQAETPLKG